MADATLASLDNALEQFFRVGRAARQENRSAVLLNLLMKMMGIGKNVAFDATFGTATGQNFADGEDVTVFNNDSEVPAILAWAIYGDAFAVTALAESASVSSRTELANLFLKKLTDAADRTAKILNSELMLGAGTGTLINGLYNPSGPLDTTGTYATIDRAVNTSWASNENANGGVPRALTIDLLEETLEDIYIASGLIPDLLITSPRQWRAYANLVAPEKRYLQDVYIRGEQIKLDGGWQALEVNGIPMFKDKDHPNDKIGFLNTDHIGIYNLPPSVPVKGRAVGMIPIAGTPQEQAGLAATPALMARVIELASSGDKRNFQIVTWCQLASDRCNAHGSLIDLITA